MSRLYDRTYDESKWKITDHRFVVGLDEGFVLTNLSTHRDFIIPGDIIGVEQISDDTFLIHQRIKRHLFEIHRLKLLGSDRKLEFSVHFKKFHFLTDDTILFDSNMVYSISKNKEIDFDYKNTNIDIYSDEDNNKNFLLVEKTLDSLYSHEYVIVLVDGQTLKPVTNAYSTLRDAYIPLSDNFSFYNLVNQDQKYLRIITDFCFERDMEMLQKGRDTLLSQI